MDKQLYIKTDGPLSECSNWITVGKVYPVLEVEEGSILGGVFVIDDSGNEAYLLTDAVNHGERCAYLGDGATWHFCDATGTPVAAPWESTKQPKLCGEEGDLCACHDSPEWNVASWKITICERPEYSEKDGLCLHCDHARKCHEEGFYSPQKSINWQAHAEALAEALNQAVTSMQDSGYSNSHLAVRAARQALAAFDQDRGGGVKRG